jgi:uncharacterized Zn finger protein
VTDGSPLEHECPACGFSRSVVHAERRKDGDVSVCYECGCISEFTSARGVLRVVKESRMMEPKFAEARRTRWKIRQLRGLPVGKKI